MAVKLNEKQLLAVEAKNNQDVIISAGAGSGKTATLSEKIFHMVDSEDELVNVEPSQLLVLTFTKNAAHEMKERILRIFKSNNSPKAKKMLSSHVQTFDSFSSYLVTSNASALGISDKINNLSEMVLKTKEKEFLDEIFEESYSDPILKDRMIKSFYKFNLQNDDNSKKDVLFVYDKLSNMLPKYRENFIKSYDEVFYSKEMFDEIWQKANMDKKTSLINCLRYCSYISEHQSSLESETFNYEAIVSSLKSNIAFTKSLTDISLGTDKVLSQFVDNLVEFLLNVGDENLYPELFRFKEENSGFFNKRYTDKSTCKADISIVHKLKEEFKLATQFSLGKDELYNRWFSLKDDVHLLIDLAEKLRLRIEDYKKKTNSYTFSDISAMALKLLTEPQYENIAESLREEFRYIMVDEYQDTNDVQEIFLASLMMPRKDGGRAHLFCVGDAKQSIYGFRNSNVALFNKRIVDYKISENEDVTKAEHFVIDMNTNYRSAKEVLDDINYLFDYYMTVDHGDIKFTDKLQQLIPGQKSNGERRLGYGIKRITYSKVNNEKKSDSVKNECACIIQDIMKKMSENPERKYSDFCILTRTKSKFSVYQKMFQEAGIPLNNNVRTNLRGVDAIIVLQSLISLLDWKINHSQKVDYRHLFASVARSYAFEYTDQQLYDILTYKDEKGNESNDRLFTDPLMVKIDNFSKNHLRSSFDTIFVNLINEFSIVSKLYKVGDYEDNVNKIESLYQIALNSIAVGEGLKDFVELFKNINKYDLQMDTDTIIQEDDAVDLMTIHASKGLERKIIYLPVSCNELSKGNQMSKPDISYSDEYGFILPDYGYNPDNVSFDLKCGNEIPDSYPYKTLPALLMKNDRKDPERDEQVRLVYVALTRAKDAIYIVGNDPSSEKADKSSENLYGMLNTAPHVELLTDNIISLVDKSENAGLLDKYYYYASLIRSFEMPLTLDDFESKDQFENYHKVGEEYILETLKELLHSVEEELLQMIFDKYGPEFIYRDFTPDELIRLKSLDSSIHSVKDYLDKLQAAFLEEVDEADEDEVNETLENVPGIDEMETILNDFLIGMRNEDIDKMGVVHPANAKKDEKHKLYINAMVKCITFDKFEDCEIYYKDYSNGDKYLDQHEHLNKIEEIKFQNAVKPIFTLPAKEKIDDAEIEFKERVKLRASHVSLNDEDNDVEAAKARGTRYHRLMELTNFTTRDTSFIKNEKDRKLVDSVLKLSLFDGITEENVKKEFSYYDEARLTNGSIDLLIEKDGRFLILDYKTTDIEPLYYDDQLNVYQENVCRIFNVTPDKVDKCLLSLTTRKLRFVK